MKGKLEQKIHVCLSFICSTPHVAFNTDYSFSKRFVADMESNRQMILDKFSQLLCEKLADQIVGKVNATRLADEFNLRAHGTRTITRQTAYNWLGGKAFPDPGRLSVLASWLNIDLNVVFQVIDT